MNCGDCNPNLGPTKCPAGRLYYNARRNQCVWADESECVPKGNPDPSTTAGTITSPTPTTGNSTSSTTDWAVSTSEGPSTLPPIEPQPQLPSPGSPCNPKDCKHTGDCTHFLICNKNTSQWERHECGAALYWNPSWNEEETGGSCDRLEDLPSEVRQKYQEDESCFEPCWYKERETCGNQFLFHPNGTDHRQILTLSCPTGLVFDEETKVCNGCDVVKNRNTGGDCCEDTTQGSSTRGTTPSTAIAYSTTTESSWTTVNSTRT
jgi:hypothetical protein